MIQFGSMHKKRGITLNYLNQWWFFETKKDNNYNECKFYIELDTFLIHLGQKEVHMRYMFFIFPSNVNYIFFLFYPCLSNLMSIEREVFFKEIHGFDPIFL